MFGSKKKEVRGRIVSKKKAVPMVFKQTMEMHLCPLCGTKHCIKKQARQDGDKSSKTIKRSGSVAAAEKSKTH